MGALERNYDEKRGFFRMKMNTAMELTFDSGASINGKCLDLSGTGASVLLDEALDMGAELEISIDPPQNSQMPFIAKVEVARVIDRGSEGYEIGLLIKEVLG